MKKLITALILGYLLLGGASIGGCESWEMVDKGIPIKVEIKITDSSFLSHSPNYTIVTFKDDHITAFRCVVPKIQLNKCNEFWKRSGWIYIIEARPCQ